MSIEVGIEPEVSFERIGRICPICGARRQVNGTSCRNCGLPVAQWLAAATAEASPIVLPDAQILKEDGHPQSSRTSGQRMLGRREQRTAPSDDQSDRILYASPVAPFIQKRDEQVRPPEAADNVVSNEGLDRPNRNTVLDQTAVLPDPHVDVFPAGSVQQHGKQTITPAFSTPPGWPRSPEGWIPPPGWQPDPSWPAAPVNWIFWPEARATSPESAPLEQEVGGWKPDPVRRHEFRYFIGGRATELVRDGALEGSDPIASQPTAVVSPAAEALHVETPGAGGRVRNRLPRAVPKSVWVGVATGAIVAIILGLLVMRSPSKKTSVQAVTLSLAAKTNTLADAVRRDLCTGDSSGCEVDGGSPGVITVTLLGSAGSESQVASTGIDTKLWSDADAARMFRTRALDGTQRNKDGSVTWTYHPDYGLQIVISVSN
jgi:hypothetical protein